MVETPQPEGREGSDIQDGVMIAVDARLAR